MSKSTKLYHLQLLQLQQIGKKVIRDHGNWLQLNLQFPRLPLLFRIYSRLHFFNMQSF